VSAFRFGGYGNIHFSYENEESKVSFDEKGSIPVVYLSSAYLGDLPFARP
jgi:hypothetical protein